MNSLIFPTRDKNPIYYDNVFGYGDLLIYQSRATSVDTCDVVVNRYYVLNDCLHLSIIRNNFWSICSSERTKNPFLNSWFGCPTWFGNRMKWHYFDASIGYSGKGEYVRVPNSTKVLIDYIKIILTTCNNRMR